MSLFRVFSVATAVVVLVGGSVVAQESCQQCPSSTAAAKSCTACPSSTVAANVDEEEGCPVSAAMGHLPKMTYKVGTETTCCSDSAAALAKEHSAPVHYVVAEKTYEDKAEAYAAYVTVTEKFVDGYANVHTCETSGTVTVAGHTCDCPVTAANTSKLVKAAMDKVTMAYKIGEEECHCPTQAGEIAKTSGEAVEYVVGESCTSCEMTAKVNLAHAKYKAGVQAYVASQESGKKGS